MQETGTGTHRERVAARERRALASHFTDLGEEVYALLHKEVELGTTEIGEKVDEVQSSVASMGTSGVLALSGFIVLLFAAVFGIATIWPLWLAALIVGGVVTLIGVIALAVGRSRLEARRLRPQRTIRTLRKDRDFVKGELQ